MPDSDPERWKAMSRRPSWRRVWQDLATQFVRPRELGVICEELEHEAGGVLESRASRRVGWSAPVRRADGERAEAGGGGRDDQPLGISKTRRQLPVEVRAALEVARVGRDQTEAALNLGKTNHEGRRPGNALQLWGAKVNLQGLVGLMGVVDRESSVQTDASGTLVPRSRRRWSTWTD